MNLLYISSNKDYLYHNNNIVKLLEYIFMIFTILQCNSVYFYMTNTILPRFIKIVWVMMLLIIMCIIFIHVSNIKAKSNYSFILFLISFFVFLFAIFIVNSINYKINTSLLSYFIETISIVILLYICYLGKNVNTLFYKFENIMLVISVLSLIFWILSLLHIPPNVNVITMGDGYIQNGVSNINQMIPGYFYIHFITQGKVNFLGITLIRNTGMFVEAANYSSILDIALFIELFVRNDSKIMNYRTYILFITILSTTSTNGTILAICAIVYSEAIKLRNNSKSNIFSLYFLPLLIIIGLIAIYFLVFDKTHIDNNYTLSSFNVRMNDFSSTLSAWKSHIFIGNGFGNKDAIIKYMAPWRFVDGGTTNVSIGLTDILASGGILFGLLYIIPLILSYKISSKIFGLAIFTFSLFVLEGVETFYIFIMVLMYLWMMPIMKKYINQ